MCSRFFQSPVYRGFCRCFFAREVSSLVFCLLFDETRETVRCEEEWLLGDDFLFLFFWFVGAVIKQDKLTATLFYTIKLQSNWKSICSITIISLKKVMNRSCSFEKKRAFELTIFIIYRTYSWQWKSGSPEERHLSRKRQQKNLRAKDGLYSPLLYYIAALSHSWRVWPPDAFIALLLSLSLSSRYIYTGVSSCAIGIILFSVFSQVKTLFSISNRWYPDVDACTTRGVYKRRRIAADKFAADAIYIGILC